MQVLRTGRCGKRTVVGSGDIAAVGCAVTENLHLGQTQLISLGKFIKLDFERRVGRRLRGEGFTHMCRKRSGILHAREAADARPLAVAIIAPVEGHLHRSLRQIVGGNGNNPLGHPRLSGFDHNRHCRGIARLENGHVVFVAEIL